jgi:tetratricopeptide (TPR) repeat protein
VWALCAALACARGAAAAEDGGVRSPLAAGAGSRALALGGAYVAVGGDAGALTWNPAGIALATRTGFEATHDERMELDASVDHAAFVLPSWRWGAAAIAIDHIGVSGIEARDDRNAVVGGLTAGETEVALGYARALGPAFCVGATVKFQSQSLGGFGSSALAADAGARVALGEALDAQGTWLEGLTCGLAIRNLLEPAIRLDRESVRDPRLWRAGLGWRTELAGGQGLQLALDLDRSDGSSAGIHAGAELQLHPLLALRVGLDDGRPTAGAGVRWRELEVSYAFEDFSSAALHRIGLAHSFGPTVEDRRTATLKAEEQSIQARLDAEYGRRQKEQTEGLLRRAGEAIDRSEFAAAMELLAAAATLDSAHAGIREIEARAQREMGLAREAEGDVAAAGEAFRRALALAPGDSAAANGEQRCRARLERLAVRDQGRRQAFQAALEALAAGDLKAARTGFAALAASDSSDADARAMLRRTEEAAARQAAELIRQARRSLDAQARDEAGQLLARARALDPRAAGLDELSAALGRPAGPAGAASTTAPARVVSSADRREADQMFRRGLAASAAGRSDDALRYWELAIALDPDNATVAHYLGGEYLVRGMDAHAAGRLEEAVGYWEKALRVDPKDPRAAGFLERARERRERTREILGGER